MSGYQRSEVAAPFYTLHIPWLSAVRGYEPQFWLQNQPCTTGYVWRACDVFSVLFVWIRCCLALGTAAESNDDAYATTSGKPNVRRHKNRKQTYSSSSGGLTCTERLRDGCSPLEWHDFHFPTCEIHEIDLRLVVENDGTVLILPMNEITTIY
jgi:hypothetical protein